MAATIATSMAMFNAKTKSMPMPMPMPTFKPMAMASLKNLPKGVSKDATTHLNLSTSLTVPAIAGAIFSTLSACEPAFAVQQIAEIAEGDNRGLALLLPIVPAIGWVLFNILQPALNQINKMTSTKGVIVGLGVGAGLAASGILATPEASASEVAALAEAATSGDNRGLLLLFVVGPAILWVLYNILQPALNQINKMKS